jgi:polygalacturonase
MVAASILSLLLGASLASAHPRVHHRADACTFTDAAAAIKGKTSCSTITLNNISVPAGQTLDMTGLKDGTTVSKSLESRDKNADLP